MSGGVDSSVAAALLLQQGYEVIGMMLRLWSESGMEHGNRCCTPDAMALARRVAARLGIPFYAVDAQEVFYDKVVNYFMDGYEDGITPNPCLVCNRYIRWGFLFERAKSIGAHFLATGHYARILKDTGEKYNLLRAIDPNKDQSYVLHMLTQELLAQTLFPLGVYTKPEVRRMASEFNLPVAERTESQDLCFLGDDSYREFMLRNVPKINSPGPILSHEGNQIGQHQGLAFYTIGQRKRIGISSPAPLYVIHKDKSSNTLIVGPSEHLGLNQLIAARVNWIVGEPPRGEIRADVKIRYKSCDERCTVTPLDHQRVRVTFDKPIRAITPGQAAVFYDRDYCLGGGIIQ